MAFAEDRQEFVRRRVLQISRQTGKHDAIDEKELAEREEAARAYAGENEQHFVDYCQDCIDYSVQAMRKIREEQSECWRIYNEEAPPQFARKEDWQSRVIIPKPFGAVQFAMAIVRKAFDVQLLSIENEADEEAATFWTKLMQLMLGRNYANFPIQFTDACGMGFAVGQSMEMIPVWRTGKGLRFVLVEPWKIHRDPDAISRQPQSGMYWIHQEYQDYWLLRKWQKEGRYRNVPTITPGSYGSERSDPMLSLEAIAARKGQIIHRSRYRTLVLTSEFWGTVLDSKGELLLPNATYTVAAGRVIRPPKASPYPTLRWPGVCFSPLPHLLRFAGRGILHGIRSLWYFMCSLLCLHNDQLNWLVNPPMEIDVSALVDPDDIDDYPGKKYLTRGTVSGQQAIRSVERKRSITNEILANQQYSQQLFEEGTFVTSLVRGLPGYRAEITAREAAQSLEQNLTVFGLIGKNLEHGALDAILAAAETIAINITYDELARMLGQEWADRYADPQSPTGLRLPHLTTGQFSVSGISALMRDWEIIKNIRDVFIPLFAQGSVFLPYLKPYSLLKALERRLNLKDEELLVDDKTAAAIDQAQQRQQEQAILVQAAQEAALGQEALSNLLTGTTTTPEGAPAA